MKNADKENMRRKHHGKRRCTVETGEDLEGLERKDQAQGEKEEGNQGGISPAHFETARLSSSTTGPR